MAKSKPLDVLVEPLIANNPVTLQVLGLCSTLAVTTKMEKALAMSIGVTIVSAFSNMAISFLRDYTPNSIRIIVQMVVIASLVIVVDQMLQAFFPEIAKTMSVFVGLIITNCIVMGRAEAYAMKNPPVMSFLDGIGNGLGYSMILMILATIRELFAFGTMFGYQILTPVTDGGWYYQNGMMVIPPSALFLIGAIIWVIRSYRPEQIEKE